MCIFWLRVKVRQRKRKNLRTKTRCAKLCSSAAMGNAPAAQPTRERNVEGFAVTYAGHVFVEAGVAFEFMVQPPATSGAPGQGQRLCLSVLKL